MDNICSVYKIIYVPKEHDITNLSNLMDILMVQFMVCGVILPLRYHTHCCLTSVIGRLDVLSNWWLTPVDMWRATSPLKLCGSWVLNIYVTSCTHICPV